MLFMAVFRYQVAKLRENLPRACARPPFLSRFFQQRHFHGNEEILQGVPCQKPPALLLGVYGNP